MLIRPYQSDDKNQTISLMSEFGGYIQDLDSTGRTNFASNGAEYFTNKLIQDTKNKHGMIYVAEEDGKIIGFIGGHIEEETEEELMEAGKFTPGVISEFFVSRNHRSRGAGGQLIKELETYFKNSGCTMIRLGVFAQNDLARNFYDKNGFKDWTIIMTKEI